MSFLNRWWRTLIASDRRRSNRMHAPKLAVYYWTGSRPQKHEVRDISPTGLYVLTDERWYPGTVVKLTLLRTDGVEEKFEHHVSVDSKAVRWGDDGVGLSFVLQDKAVRGSDNPVLNEITDTKSMEKFLKHFWKKTEEKERRARRR